MTQFQELVTLVAQSFPSFGGGKANLNNPLSIALQNKPPMFAAGVDVETVVRFVLKKSASTGRRTKGKP